MTANGEPSADTFAALHELLGPLNKTGVDLKPETTVKHLALAVEKIVKADRG